MKENLLKIMIGATLAVGLAGCGGDKNASGPAAGEAPANPKQVAPVAMPTRAPASNSASSNSVSTNP
ncbi:MAG: hypothetical protein EOP04_10640 [Proteobacteria bacterium]|nr:MAG: hypothetical protein EOP04_10640 [Pseudomonadota bacterium]